MPVQLYRDTNRFDSVILSSGGMDSFLIWYLFHREAVNLFVDVGQKYYIKERRALQRLKDALPEFLTHTMQGAQIAAFEHESGIIPFRNAELIMCAAQYADEIIMGVIAHEINSDKSPEFMASMVRMLNISHAKQYWTEGREFSILTPGRAFTKTDLVALYLRSGGDPDLLKITVSCYSDYDDHCGECPSCFKRWVALHNNYLEQPFAKNPIDWAVANGIVEKCYDGTYNADRATEILLALERVR